ncbi:MAG TPA: UxaA family hydrolase [Vicinamibacterales bacterium]|jgi:(2R)-sulfolactate sulfo-lyase subunit alpha
MAHKFLVHAPDDSVGVAIREIEAGEAVEGVVLSDNSVVTVKATQKIPLGHKIALQSIAAGATVIKYSIPIGVATSAIKPGEHVHVQNVKSGRW